MRQRIAQASTMRPPLRRLLAVDDDIHVRGRRRPVCWAACPSSSTTRSTPIAKPTPGSLPAELRDEPIVAAAGAHRILGAQRIGNPFEYRAGVVIEPAHQARIDRVGDPDRGQRGAQYVEVRARFGVEVVRQQRRARDELAASPGSCCPGCAADCRQTPAAVLVERASCARKYATSFSR